MALSETQWEEMHRALWAAVQAHSARLGETTAEYVQSILAAVQAGGLSLAGEAEAQLADYLDSAEGAIRAGIEAAVAPVTAGMSPGLRDAFIRARTAEAYARRWPDGLHLSRRVWEWQDRTRRGVDNVLRQAVAAEEGSNSILMDMQRAIEAQEGRRFARVQFYQRDWASELYSAGRRSAAGPGSLSAWHRAVTDAMSHVEGLRDGGTRRQAQHALEAMRAAVRAGNEQALQEAIKWWLYDKQLYSLRRIARTEMATAHHRAVIAVAQDDELVLGYHWRLSASHPVRDICDQYAAAEFGLGAGVWPKDRVPRGKAHPQCMCPLIPTTRPMRRDGVRGEEPTPELLAHAAQAGALAGESGA